MKLVTILVQNSKYLPYDLVLPPGASVSDIRIHLNLHEDYVFALLDTPHVSFEEDADVHARIMDGDRLIAMTSVQAADAFIQHIAFGEGEI
jgi:hypothetical protein